MGRKRRPEPLRGFDFAGAAPCDEMSLDTCDKLPDFFGNWKGEGGMRIGKRWAVAMFLLAVTPIHLYAEEK